MRKDIEIHIATNDVTITPQNIYELHPFQWVSNPNGLVRYIYGEIEVPAAWPVNRIRENGIYCTIPYTAKYKEFYIRIKRVYSATRYEYMQNPVNGSEWFLAQTALYGGTAANAFASQLRHISEEDFRIMFDQDKVFLYSASESDFNIVKANRQNANLMLACIPTNNYRYPVTGVGLIRWNKSNILSTDLADILAREFQEDGTPVVTAGFDFDTNGLQLKLDTSNVDSE